MTRNPDVLKLHSKFSQLPSKNIDSVERRKEICKISYLFCIKKHPKPLNSLGERVVSSCMGDFRKLQKMQCARDDCIHNYTSHTSMIIIRVLVLGAFLKHLCNFNQLVLQDHSTDFDDFLCKIKKRSCLFHFCIQCYLVFYSKVVKTSSEV